MGETRERLASVIASSRGIQRRTDRISTAPDHKLGLAGGQVLLYESSTGYPGVGGDRSSGKGNAVARLHLLDARRRPARRHAAPRPAAGPARSRTTLSALARRLFRFDI